MKVSNPLTILILSAAVFIGGVFLLNNNASELSVGLSPESNLAKPSLSSDKEVKVWADHDSDKGLNITPIDESGGKVTFSDYLSCLHPDYLKSYPKYPGILSKNNACINKRMQHDILLQKLATAERSAGLAKDKADMVQEALDYASAHKKDESVDLSILFLFKGIDDKAYYEKASFSPQCLVQGSEKYGPKFAGMLKPKGDSSSAFVDSTPATQARKVQFLKEVEELYKKGEELSSGNITAFLAKNIFGVKLNIFEPAAMSLFIGVLSESAAKRGYTINASLLKRTDVPAAVGLNIYKAPCNDPEKIFRLNLGVYWSDKGISKAANFPPGRLVACLTQGDKDDYLNKMKNMMSDRLKDLRKIQAKYEEQARAYASDMKKLEDGDPDCFNLPASGENVNNEETKPPTAPTTPAPAKSSLTPASYQGYAPSSEKLNISSPLPQSTTIKILNSSLALSYDSNQKEASLKAVVEVSVSAGLEEVKIPEWGFLLKADDSNPTHTTYASGLVISATGADKQPNQYSLSLGQSATFKLTAVFDPKIMFAGSYAVSLQSVFLGYPKSRTVVKQEVSDKATNAVSIKGLTTS